jgi:hypothetical protein
MKVGEFAQRARALRLHTKNDAKTGLERSRFDRRVFRTSCVKFHSETKCRMEALIPYPKAVASRRG